MNLLKKIIKACVLTVLYIFLGLGICLLFAYFRGDTGAEATITSAIITGLVALFVVTFTIDEQRETTNKMIEAQKRVFDEEIKQKEIVRMRELSWQIYPATYKFLKDVEKNIIVIEQLSNGIVIKQNEEAYDSELVFKIRDYYKILRNSVVIDAECLLKKVVQLSFLEKEYKLSFINDFLKPISAIEEKYKNIEERCFMGEHDEIFLKMYRIDDIEQINKWVEMAKNLNMKFEVVRKILCKVQSP